MSEVATWFAKAERAAPAAVEQSRQRLDEACPELRVVDALPLMTLAVNAFRQVVFANRAFLAFLGDRPLDQVLGRRPGEILGCVNAGLRTYPQERLNMAEFRILQEFDVHSFCDALKRVPRPLASETTTAGRGPLDRDRCVATTDGPTSGVLD